MTYYQSLNLSFENLTTANTISSMQCTTHVVRENHMEEVNAAQVNQIKSSQMVSLHNRTGGTVDARGASAPPVFGDTTSKFALNFASLLGS